MGELTQHEWALLVSKWVRNHLFRYWKNKNIPPPISVDDFSNIIYLVEVKKSISKKEGLEMLRSLCLPVDKCEILEIGD